MGISTIARHIREGSKSLIRNGWMSFASISAVAVTLLILGATLGLAMNAQQMSNYVTGQLEISVFLKPQVSDSQGVVTANQVKDIHGVESVQVVTHEEGFKQLQDSLGQQYKDVLNGLPKNQTIPVKLVVKAQDPRQTVAISNKIQDLPNVDTVVDGKSYVDKFYRFMDTVRNIGLIFVVALILMAMFLISNTIKIAIFNRRREIEIMKLVGATNWFIRWPFLIEGMLIGAVGAVIPFAVIWVVYRSMFERMNGSFIALTFPLLPPGQMLGKLAVVMFGIGLLIGLWGGIMSIRKFLRV
ncbi:MAG: permease-like cell division protein FtsX [Alicyclobacillus herbarius]|uniref:permease-like cell division protein FtsX n=1 Tax=Alicyclobacillus herbarius TaxID=122960 RepID=UPI00235443E1|nr:permease-like cell division protein FtsX [Alicyclobacillus herbarius]MCL6633865.1 permease-like cell division protein FtsX [Alicyclobacillus herbarius]